MYYKRIFPNRVSLSKKLCQRSLESKPYSSWVPLRISFNDLSFLSCQTASNWQIKGISPVYWYEASALCDKEITLREWVWNDLDRKLTALLSRSIRRGVWPWPFKEFHSPSCEPESYSYCWSPYPKGTLFPSFDSFGLCLREVFLQNVLWCTASPFVALEPFHAPEPTLVFTFSGT